MKRVFSTSLQVAHLYANQSQNDARCRNASFDSLSFYSYSTRIAYLHNNKPEPLLLIDSYGYSNTTRSHVGDLFRAFDSNTKILRVPAVHPRLGDHDVNYNYFFSQIADALASAKKARTRGPEYITDANNTIEDMRWYAEFFELMWDIPEPVHIAADALDKMNQQRQAARDAKLAKEKLDQAEKLALWMAGDASVHMYFTDLRLRLIGEEIQTSHGARIPVADALKFWPILRRLHNKNMDFVFKSEVKFGSYQARHFKDDMLVVGCHNIPYSEIERMAVQLNLLEAA